jgi:hypothetical protein
MHKGAVACSKLLHTDVVSLVFSLEAFVLARKRQQDEAWDKQQKLLSELGAEKSKKGKAGKKGMWGCGKKVVIVGALGGEYVQSGDRTMNAAPEVRARLAALCTAVSCSN